MNVSEAACVGFVRKLQEQGCTRAFDSLHNAARFDEPPVQSMLLDILADCRDLPQLPEDVKNGFSGGYLDRAKVVYFVFEGRRPGQTCIAALVKPQDSPLKAVFCRVSAKAVEDKDRIMARIARQTKPSPACVAA